MKKSRFAAVAAIMAVMLFCTACSSTPEASSVTETPSSTASSASAAPESTSPASSEAGSDVSSEAAEPSESPVETPPGTLVESTRVEDSYFDDAVFIGDSVSLKLNRYASEQRKSNANFMGKAQFLTAGSMGSGNALQPVSDESIHPMYNGENCPWRIRWPKAAPKRSILCSG